MKTINDIVDWLISSGALTALFIFAWLYLKPVLETKKTHAKTEQAKAAWDYLEQVSDTAVSALVHEPMLGADKFKKAVASVTETMIAKGLHPSNEDVQQAVQAAYEKSDLTKSDDPVLQAIKKAPNRANHVEKARG